MPAPQLLVQTTYAELLERCAATAFSDAFPEDGSFTAKTINGRRYWYFQSATAKGRTQRYVGPETPGLLERIAHHKQIRDDERERRVLVSTLIRSYGLPAPLSQIGQVISALARAGVFRLRSVLVGTLAYQTYPAMLGLRLPNALLQTSDVDIAQFTSVSIAVADQTGPMLEVLKGVDKSFREVPPLPGRQSAVSYEGRGGLRVDFLTPNEGPDTDDPQILPALRTAALPLCFMDFLIHEPQPAVVLRGSGIYLQVPAPERFAVHKLIISMRRPSAMAKREKDIQQAEALLEALCESHPEELRHVWEEAYGRGPRWRKFLLNGMTHLEPHARDILLKTLSRSREILPGASLTFNSSPARYDSTRDIVAFAGQDNSHSVACAVSREALEDHFGAGNLDKNGRLEALLKNRAEIEQLLRAKYLHWPIEEPEAVLLGTLDIDNIRKTSPGSESAPASAPTRREEEVAE